MDTERQVNSHEQEGQRQGRQGQGPLLIHHMAKLRPSNPQPSLEDDIRRAYTLRYKLIPQARKDYKRVAKQLEAETFEQMSLRLGVRRRALYRSTRFLREQHPVAYATLMERKAILRQRLKLNVIYQDLRREWKTLAMHRISARHKIGIGVLRNIAEVIRYQVKDEK